MLAEAIPHRRTGASSRVRCFMCIAAVAVACATDDASPERRDVGDGAALPPVDAGLCPDIGPNTSRPQAWARSPETGECCRYVTARAAPPSWPSFETEAECEGSCRCSVLEGLNEDFGLYETERTSLECRCSAETCPSTVAEAEQLICSRSSSRSVQRLEGCGRVMIDMANGATGEAWIFERPLASVDAGGASERLIGGHQFSDVPSGPCHTFLWIAGRGFDCDDVTACRPCDDDESGLSSLPRCE